jgi:hypothetical protein
MTGAAVAALRDDVVCHTLRRTRDKFVAADRKGVRDRCVKDLAARCRHARVAEDMGAELLFTGARGVAGRTVPHADRNRTPQCQLFRSCGVADARRLVAIGVEDRDDPVERVNPAQILAPWRAALRAESSLTTVTHKGGAGRCIGRGTSRNSSKCQYLP